MATKINHEFDKILTVLCKTNETVIFSPNLSLKEHDCDLLITALVKCTSYLEYKINLS